MKRRVIFRAEGSAQNGPRVRLTEGRVPRIRSIEWEDTP